MGVFVEKKNFLSYHSTLRFSFRRREGEGGATILGNLTHVCVQVLCMWGAVQHKPDPTEPPKFLLLFH